MTISFLIEFLISIKIIEKKTINNKILDTNKYCKFSSVSLIKLLSMNVKNVKKPRNSVIINIIIIKIFFFINLSIIM